jgi:alkylation response protein AidB-like acyl-CoA dehydrogenase
MPPDGSDEPPEYRFAILPKQEVELLGNWDVLGLQSTASLDYRLENVLIPDEATFLFATPTRHRGEPIFELGVIALTAVGHSGFAIGVARRALDELMAIAKTKVRMGSAGFLKDSEAFQLKLGTLESRFRAATAWVYQAFDDLEVGVNATGAVDVKAINVTRQATVHVTQEAAEIVREAYLLAGTTALRDGALQRCFRDIHAGSQHFFASPASTLAMAADLMEAAPDSALDA